MNNLYSKDLINKVLDFFITGAVDNLNVLYNFETMLQAYELDHTGITIDRLKNFDIIKKPDFQFPYGVLYENVTDITTYELSNDLNVFEFALNFSDSRVDVDHLRNNLYAYRDSCSFMINHFRDLGGICTQSYRTKIKPPVIMSKTPSNYRGVIELVFKVWDQI